MRWRRLTSWTLCGLLAVPAQLVGQMEITAKPIPADQSTQSTPGQADAAELLKAADKSIANLVDTARNSNDPALDPNSEKAKPFWSAVKTANEAVAKAERGLFLKDDTFFSSMAEAHSAIIEAQVGLRMSGSENAAVSGALGQSAEILGTLQQNFSKEASRLQQGGELSTEERERLDQIKQEQVELQAKLTELEGKVGKNEIMIDGLREVRQKSEKVTSSGSGVGDFIAGLFAAHLISSLIWGWHWWWGPWGAWVPDFCFVQVDIWVDAVDVIGYDWVLAEQLIDVADLDFLADLEALDAAELAAVDDFLEAEDFAVDAEGMMELTDDLEVGWDDLETDVSGEVLDGYADDFGHSVFENELDIDTFEDVDLDLEDEDDLDW